ncbi:MAG: DUF4003 family protein [Micrococcales bacterium]|nr:DUF4003 family protein [Micrococcales bacterium]
MFSSHDAVLDVVELKKLGRDIRKKPGSFSAGVEAVMAAWASVSSDPGEGVYLMKMAWKALVAACFAPGPHLSMASVVLAEHVQRDDFKRVSRSARRYYAAQRSDHSIITGADDAVPSLLMVLSPMDVPTAATRTESMYQTVRPWFGHNDAQALAQVLVVGGAKKLDPGRVMAMRNALRRAGAKVVDPSALGLLVLASCDHEWLSGLVAQVSAELSASRVPARRFGKATRDTLATVLVALAVADDPQVGLVRAVHLNAVARLVARLQPGAVG